MRVHKTPPATLRRVAAAAVIALGILGPVAAHALGLGRITVLSALGEPLRAEIDVPQINADEAASLKAGVAAPDAFRAAGVDYNAALSGILITLQQRPDGSRFLQVKGDKSVSEPFVDLILEASWASGRIVRDYTMLFDPPGTARPAAAAPVAAQVPATDAAPAPPPAPVQTPAPATSEPVEAAPVPAVPQTPPKPAGSAPASSPPVAKAAAPVADSSGQQVKVQAGDTAGRIAAANKPADVSLDQMLVAMLRANPDAFIGGNVNRIRAGVLLDLPGAEQAASINTAEARKIVTVQSTDFNAFRRRLAQSAPTARAATASREASGKVQAEVQENKSVAVAPDKLTLSKGAIKAGAPEARIAETRQKKEAADRVAELSKNISDLAKLQGSSGPAKAASGAAGPALPVGQPVTPPASAPKTVASAALPSPSNAIAASTPATATATATAPGLSPASAAASTALAAVGTDSQVAAPVDSAASTPAKPAVSTPKPKPSAAAKLPPMPEPSFVDELLDNPLLPAGALGLVALLAGFGFYRTRQRKKAAPADSSFLESRGQPDSFFGSSGGQRVDTNDEAPTGSSLAYSPSQLDAAGDVDPVAEADVYLAYGRDIQAEEILKEALKVKPTRVGIHVKLLEIYAKRRDVRAFETVAAEAHKLTQGEGLEWEHICELGRDLDGQNGLYQPGGKPQTKSTAAIDAELVRQVFASSTLPAEPVAEFAPSTPPTDVDLDLDLTSPLADGAPAHAHQTGAQADMTTSLHATADMEWKAPAASHPSAPSPDDAGPLDISSVDFDTQPPSTPVPAADDAGMIEFDLGSLSLDLDHTLPKVAPVAEATPPAAAAMVPSEIDAMETKLSLAQEFHTIGDAEGARVLVEEVVASATGPLKAKAQRFLAELD